MIYSKSKRLKKMLQCRELSPLRVAGNVGFAYFCNQQMFTGSLPVDNLRENLLVSINALRAFSSVG